MVARSQEEMKWLIVGGGQLAKSLEAELITNNTAFISLTRSQLDISDKNQVNDVLFDERPNVVVNAAAWTKVDLAETHESEARIVNALGPEFLAQASMQIESSFVQISTDYVFSGLSRTPWNENAVTAPGSAYGRTKAEGEYRVLKAYPQGTKVLRTAWLYSQYGKNFVKTIAKVALEESRTIEVVSDQIGQPTSAYDLASHIRLLVEANARPGIYHGTNAGSASWFDLAQFVFNFCGADPERVKPCNTINEARIAIRPHYSVLGHEKWLEEGLMPMRDWRIALEDALPTIISESS
jgi:dTDP-4-dehydrorhamnose reductase